MTVSSGLGVLAVTGTNKGYLLGHHRVLGPIILRLAWFVLSAMFTHDICADAAP